MLSGSAKYKRLRFVRFQFDSGSATLTKRKTNYLEHGSGSVGLGTLLTFELLICHVAGLVVLPQALLITRTHSINCCAVLWIRSFMFLGLRDPDPSFFIIKKMNKILISTVL
jgi:hypothetical protein